MQRLIYIIAVFAIIATSCDDREAFFDSLNANPEITIKGYGDSTYRDSVKISLKTSEPWEELTFQAKDDNNIKNISFETESGEVNIYQHGEQITELTSGFDEFELRIEPVATGENVLIVTVTDEFDKQSRIRIMLTAFNNLPPVAEFSHEHIAVNSEYEYQFSSNSYDTDASFGGHITKYEWKINDQTIPVENPTYSFPEPGNYQVVLRVQDNDGAWSSTETKQITVE